MTVKNIGNKLIGIGSVDLFPGDCKKVPDDFASNSTLKTYEELGFIVIVEDKKPAKPTKAKKTGKDEEADASAEE